MEKHENEKKPAHRYSTTMEKVLTVLEYLSRNGGFDGLGISEVSRGTGLEKAAVYRSLNTLLHNGYLVRRGKSYAISSKLVWLAGEFLEKVDVRRIAHPHLISIAEETGELSFLSVLEGKEAVIIEKVEGSKDLRLFSHVGTRFPLHCAATGKLFLAFVDENRRKELLNGMDFHKYTEHTITSSSELEKHLLQVRCEGIAFNDLEQDYQKRAVAAPLFTSSGEMTAAICVAGVAGRFEERQMKKAAKLLHESAIEISKELGFYPRDKEKYWSIE